MTYSILFPKNKQFQETNDENSLGKSYFKDLGLDLVFKALINPKQDFKLERYYYESLQDIETITYRQEVMKDLEFAELRNIVALFSNEVYYIRQYMNSVREDLSSEDKWSNNYLTRGRMLDYAERYCTAISKFQEGISKIKVTSSGIEEFTRYINNYSRSDFYKNFVLSVKQLREGFSTIEYCMLINAGRIRVRKYEGQKDFSKQILSTFEKFRQGDVKDYRKDFKERPVADHVEAAVLDLVSKHYKDIFNRLTDFCAEFMEFDDETIIRFSQEIQFYISWLDFIQPLRDRGLSFNYPMMNHIAENLYGYDCFDLALALRGQIDIVTNDFSINSPENIIVVTGPNQGGKTTYAKMIGQMHHLASVGLSVQGKTSSLFLVDNIYTHFAREENLSTQSGKLKDDLERLYDVLSNATNRSLIIINEIFTSTTLKDAVTLGSHMMERLTTLKAPAIIVTFLDELAIYGNNVVSMMSTVEKDDPMVRTFKIIRKPPDGLAYAIHIASRHRLTYDQLFRRLN